MYHFPRRGADLPGRLALFLTAVILATSPASSQVSGTYHNPLFSSQDPYVIYSDGYYYYSEGDGDRIFIRKSPTLIGLKDAVPQLVWTSVRRGWDGHANLWAPEIHVIDGKSYLYFAADYYTDGRHFLYVLEGGSDPLGPYRAGATGYPDGLLVESTGQWAIDPNVFLGPDGLLYITWSCTDNPTGKLPASLCLARMSDPLHIEGQTVRISRPVEPWETRTGALQEGPVGYARGGITYITYSASASWTTNDYTVGLLVNASGDLLNPAAWEKRGPIFDRHGSAYGPGSVVFVESPDGSEIWNLYHAYDRLDCPRWGCRSIRAQKVKWNADGTPLLGYPMDPRIQARVPSGDTGSRSGWGNSISGDAASGAWTYFNRSSLKNTRGEAGPARQATFRGEVDPVAYTVTAEIRRDGAQVGRNAARYGIYAIYVDPRNYLEVFLDSFFGVFGTRAVVEGENQGLELSSLPAGTNFDQFHSISVAKSAAHEFDFALDNVPMGRRIVALDRGQVGAFTENTGAQFRNLTLTGKGAGWGDAFGDAAKGLDRNPTGLALDGYARGAWRVPDGSSAMSVGLGPGWNALYQGNPNLESYAVEAEAQFLAKGTAPGRQRYGIIVCHDDRESQVGMWIEPGLRYVSVESVLGGVTNTDSMALPPGFDPADYHRLRAEKSGRRFTFFLDGVEVFRRDIDITNGTAGVATWDTQAGFRSFASGAAASFFPSREIQ